MVFGIIRLWLYMSTVKPIVALSQIIIPRLTRRTLSRRARSSRATSRVLSAPIDVPFATLRHLPARPIASTGQWALPGTRLMVEQCDIRIPDHIIAFHLSSSPFNVISSLNTPRGLRNAIRRYHNEHATINPPSVTTRRYDGEPVYIPEENLFRLMFSMFLVIETLINNLLRLISHIRFCDGGFHSLTMNPQTHQTPLRCACSSRTLY